MIGYITKVRSFGALARYLQSGTGRPEESRVLWTTARYVSGDLRTAATEMNLTGHLAETKALGYHLTIGYDPADRPTRAEMEHAVERTLGALGLDDNMAITAAHGDAYFAHTHTMVARWDYWTARVVEASNSYYKITQVMRELEEELRMAPAPRPYWQRAGRETEAGRDGVEGRPSARPERLSAAVRERARSALRSATSWRHLQTLLRSEGLRFVRGRDNLLIARGEATLRAGQIAGGTSLAKLEARFGQTLREHEAEVAGRLIERPRGAPSARAARKRETAKLRTRRGEDAETDGRDEGEEKQAERLLQALAETVQRREEAYHLTRRSALLEAEEADATGLHQDLQRLEAQGTALVEKVLEARGPASRSEPADRPTGESEVEEGRLRNGQARELWRAAARSVEGQGVARGTVPDGLRGIVGGEGAGGSSQVDEEPLLALLHEHRQVARRAVELFGPDETSAGGRSHHERDGHGRKGGPPGRTPETETPENESFTGAGAGPEAVSLLGAEATDFGTDRPSEEKGAPASRSAAALLRRTRAAIREARAGLEKRLLTLKRQARAGEGAAELERRLGRVLVRLAERDLEAASRFARRYVREPGREGEGDHSPALAGEPLEGEILQSPAVQAALRRALPDGVQLDGKRGQGRKSASRSR